MLCEAGPGNLLAYNDRYAQKFPKTIITTPITLMN